MKCITRAVKLAPLISMVILSLAAQGWAIEAPKGLLGIYAHENLEGEHTVSSAAGTELANAFVPLFAKVVTFDKVPLTSNETVRILEKMTKDRKVVVTAVSTWLSGGVLAAPTLTLADDSIKFKDLA